MKTPAHAMMAVFFVVGFLVATTQCRPEEGRRRSFYSGSKGGGGNDTSIESSARPLPIMSNNSTAMEEEKLYVKFCIHQECTIDGKIYNECGCCELLPPYPMCFKSTELCKVWCPTCHPNCPHTPPQPPSSSPSSTPPSPPPAMPMP
uniref:Uncharacterized protein n=1 Tax=Hordeum vulgare subsp. vulgare TaxID=112509 RepID=A0A8I6WML7_HORVV